MLLAPLDDGECDERRGGDDQQERNGGRFAGPVGREREREEEEEDEYGEGRETDPVNRGSPLQLRDFTETEAGPGGAEDADRHVHVEQGPPVEDGEDDPADRQPGHRSHPERDLVDPQGQAELVGGGGIDDHRRAVREEDRGAEPLNRPERDDLGGIHREAREEGTEREHPEPARVQLYTTDDVSIYAYEYAGDGDADDVCS